MKRVFLKFLLIGLTVLLLPSTALAQDETGIDHYNTVHYFDAKTNPTFEEVFTYKDIKTLMQSVSKEINEYTSNLESEGIITPKAYALFVGQDKTCTSGDYSYTSQEAPYGNPIINRAARTDYGGFADVEVNASMKQQRTHGKAWAWIGNRIGVYSNGGQTQGNCKIDFSGWVKGYIYYTSVLTGAQVAVWAEVKDLDTGEFWQFEDWYVQNSIGTINRAHSESGTVRCIFRCGEAAVPELWKPPVRNWETALDNYYWLINLSRPYTSRIDMSFDGSMLSILIL